MIYSVHASKLSWATPRELVDSQADDNTDYIYFIFIETLLPDDWKRAHPQ